MCTEVELGRHRAAVRQDVADGAVVAIILGAAGIVLLTGLLAAQIIYALRFVVGPVRRVAQAAERVRSGDLDARVPEIGRGEIRQLAASFNAMGGAIQAQTEELSRAKAQLESAVLEAEQASGLKSNFLANMSHEIRTPLNGVIGMLGLLSETALSGEQQEFVQIALASGEALMAVLSDVLDIAKIEAGRLDVEQRDFDLGDAVELCCDMVAASAQVKQLELQSYIHRDVPRGVLGDRTRVAQILANLLSNAVKFTAAGEVVLEVDVVERKAGETVVRFVVRDTGIGIDEERILELFKPFVQADPGTTRGSAAPASGSRSPPSSCG